MRQASDWGRRAVVSALAALLLTAARIVPAPAELDDGDGFDGDGLVLPLALLAVAAVAVWALLGGRRGNKPIAGV